MRLLFEFEANQPTDILLLEITVEKMLGKKIQLYRQVQYRNPAGKLVQDYKAISLTDNHCDFFQLGMIVAQVYASMDKRVDVKMKFN